MNSERKAVSEYGYLRLTIHFTRTGRAYYRAYAKKPSAHWSERDLFALGAEDFVRYPPTFADALLYQSSVADGLRWLPQGTDIP